MSIDATPDTTGVVVVRAHDAAPLESMPVGAELAGLVFATDPRLLDPNTQVAYAVACQRLINTITALQDAGLVAFVGNNPRDTVYFVDGSEHALTDVRALELQLALAWSEGLTRSRIASARTLFTELPACAAVVETGAMQPAVKRAISEGAASLTASIDEAIADAVRTHAIPAGIEQLREVRRDLLHAFDTKLAAYAPGRSLKAVGKKVRDTIATLDPQGVLARRAKALRTQSDVRVTSLHDGMALLTAILPTEQAHACMRVIDTLARDTNSYDQADPIGMRRTQVLFDRITRRHTGPRAGEGEVPASQASLQRPGASMDHTVSPRSRSGLPVHLDVVMPLDAFLGLSDDPANMPGAGPVPAHAVRELLGDAAYVKIRRILTDPRTGHALDLGVRRYQLTEAEQDRIALRDRVCRMLDCQAPAYRCECDHAQPYGDGGPTSTANLGLACKRHHQHKTHAGWHIIDSEQDGSCTWVSPLGRQYRHDPEPVLPTAPAPPPRINPDNDPPPF